MAYVKLRQYKPYNDFWFRNCFYHSLAQIAGSLGIIDCLLADEIMRYVSRWEEGLPVLAMEQRQIKGWDACLRDCGVLADEQVSPPDELIPCICRSLDDGRPAVVPVDCFYEPLRRDCYGQEHMAHYIVVIGYDDDRRECIVLEHSYENDLSYRERTLRYEEMTKAYAGFLAHIRPDAAYLTFDTRRLAPVDTGATRENILTALEDFRSSLPCLSRFVEDFSQEFVGDNIEDAVTAKCWFMVMDIINPKRIQFSQFEAIRLRCGLPDDRIHAKVLYHWTLVMGLISRIRIRMRWNEQEIRKIVEEFREIEAGERLWSEAMLHNLKGVGKA